MTERERILGLVLLLTLAVSGTAVNLYALYSRHAEVDSLAERYAATRRVALRSLQVALQKREQLQRLEQRAVPATSEAPDPYSLGRQCRALFEQAGFGVRSFSLVGSGDQPVLEASLTGDRTRLPQLFMLLDASQPQLSMLYCSISTATRADQTGLELTVRMAYAARR